MLLLLLTTSYTIEFSVETRLEHDFAIEKTYYPLKITFCTLFSLVQLLKRFKAAFSAKSQNNALLMGKL